jgi:hypothetical protein
MNIADINKADKAERTNMFFDYLTGLGFTVNSTCIYHCYCRYPDFRIDIWATTAKMDVVEHNLGKKPKRYNGYQSILNEINRLHKLYLESNNGN